MSSNTCNNNISLRKTTQSDIPFMISLYASTRTAELAMTNFSEQEKLTFIEQQFNAQYAHYNQHYCNDFFNIVEIDGEAVGRLFVDYWENEIRIVDIVLAPKQRNSGLGSYLFKTLFNQAKEMAKPITIHVEKNNPAKRLYERLGFTLKTQTNEVYLLMQWIP